MDLFFNVRNNIHATGDSDYEIHFEFLDITNTHTHVIKQKSVP